MDEQDNASQPPRDALGLAAVITGVLLLSPIAIVLGHLSLRRGAKDPRASRTFGLAGVILGYAGLVFTVAGIALYLFVVQPAQDAATADARAQADVTSIGNAVASYYETGSAVPRVIVGDGSYTVASEIVDAQLTGDRAVTVDGTSRIDWCVELSYSGGDVAVVSYVGSTGYQPGTCG